MQSLLGNAGEGLLNFVEWTGAALVARGFSETSHRPAGLRSSPNSSQSIWHSELPGLGVLRTPAGINPLAT